MAYWDEDDKKDLVIGRADGTVQLFHNTLSDTDPSFDGGTLLQVGPAGGKSDIDVGDRATVALTDWDGDGARDLVLGAADGKIRVFINEGTATAPDYGSEMIVQNASLGIDLVVPSFESSPVLMDLDGDGRKDLLSGNANGELLLYSNQGTDSAPSFSFCNYVEADGVKISLPGGYSRAFVTDWTGDARLDVLVGSGQSNVYLFQSLPPVPGDTNEDDMVDGLDYNAWSLRYQHTGVAPWSQGGWQFGNFNEDTTVDGLDYNVWSLNYGYGWLFEAAPVPEPTALILLAPGALLRRRRRA